jgi:predicted Zn-dependent protease
MDMISTSDIEAEIQFGRELASRVLGKYGYVNNEALTRYVNLVCRALARNANRPELKFHVAVLKTDTINAYAAPGGYIFITRGALMNMENEAQLAAVIAHEMAHITGRHIVKELNIHGSDSSPVSGFARFLGGSGDPAKMTFLNMVDKAMDILFENGYKREDEKDADTIGAIILAMSGYDPKAMTAYFNKIEKAKGDNLKVLNKTHPSFDERIALIDETLKAEGLAKGKYKTGGERFNAAKKSL